jgi:peptidoglycan/xylan/chitin deacetylase (PgdA/CDA1 family)
MPAPRHASPRQLALAERRRVVRRQRIALAVAPLAAAAVAVILVTAGSGTRSSVAARGTSVSAAAPHRHVAPRHQSAPLRPLVIAPARPGRARVVVSGHGSAPAVALTFDDGFCARCVARIVDVLWRTGTHATFFPNGIYRASWEPQAARIRTMIARGQVVVGNHTFRHGYVLGESSSAFGQDLAENERWIQRTFHVSGRPWFRPPYGAYNAQALTVAGQQGYTRVVLWSGTLADSSPRTVPYLRKAVRDWVRPGAIFLAHANYPNTAADLPHLIRMFTSRHLRLATLAELPGAPAGQEGTPTPASPAIPAL